MKSKRIFWGMFILTFLYGKYMGASVKPLTIKEVVTMEFLPTATQITQELQSWEPGWKDLFLQSIYLDYFYMLLYGLTFAWGCIAVTEGKKEADIGKYMAVLAIMASLLDFIENQSMFHNVVHAPSDVLAMLTVVCASLKFALIFVCIGFIVYHFFKRDSLSSSVSSSFTP